MYSQGKQSNVAQQLFGLVFSLVLLLITQIVVFMRYVKSRCMPVLAAFKLGSLVSSTWR